MKFYENNNLCLTYAEYLACFKTPEKGLEAYKSDKKRSKLLLYGRGGNGSEILIDYEALDDDRKKLVVEKYGDPYKYIVKQPLKDWVKINWNKVAFDFYNKHVLKNGAKLPESYRDKYTKAVTYMDAINHYSKDKIALKRDFNINLQAFWGIVADVINAENVALPSNERRLKDRLKAFKLKGFTLLIEDHRFANDNSKKVKDQLAEDMLMKLLELDNKHADNVVTQAYNNWAEANGREKISESTVGYRRRKNYHEIIMAREGKAAAYNKYNIQIKQRRASSPLMLINSDDNVLDLYFKEVTYAGGRKNTNNYYRPVMYVLTDCFNDYPLGYAVGETVTIELIKQAYRNAIAHVEELIGAPYVWGQIKTDKWSIDPKMKGDLATFLGNQSIFFTAAVPQSKYIERVFGYPMHRVLKAFPNYSGGNITAKSVSSRPNMEALQKRSKDFPDKSKASAQIDMVINAMRHSKVKGNEDTRQQQWIKAFRESEYCANQQITIERKLELFGVKHETRDYEPVRLRTNGINFQLNNVKYSFDIPATLFPEHNNKPVELYYDTYDMSRVLVTDHKGLRFVAESYVYQHSAIADMREGDGKLLHERKEAKKAITAKMEKYVEDRDARLQRAEIDANSLMQANVLTKGINHKAQKTLTGYTSENEEKNEAVLHIPAAPKPKAKEKPITISIYDDM